jgi:hypothetical protein
MSIGQLDASQLKVERALSPIYHAVSDIMQLVRRPNLGCRTVCQVSQVIWTLLQDTTTIGNIFRDLSMP